SISTLFPYTTSSDLSATWVAGTTLTHVGLNANYPVDDDWAISKAFDLNKANSDASGVIVIKNFALTGAVPSQFTWKYATAGTYRSEEHTSELQSLAY